MHTTPPTLLLEKYTWEQRSLGFEFSRKSFDKQMSPYYISIHVCYLVTVPDRLFTLHFILVGKLMFLYSLCSSVWLEFEVYDKS